MTLLFIVRVASLASSCNFYIFPLVGGVPCILYTVHFALWAVGIDELVICNIVHFGHLWICCLSEDTNRPSLQAGFSIWLCQSSKTNAESLNYCRKMLKVWRYKSPISEYAAPCGLLQKKAGQIRYRFKLQTSEVVPTTLAWDKVFLFFLFGDW